MQTAGAERRVGVQKCLWLSMLLAALALLSDGVAADDHRFHLACADAAPPAVEPGDDPAIDPGRALVPAGCSRPTDGDRSANPANPAAPGPRLKPLLRERIEQAPGTVVREDRRRLPA